jgi:hypothetical protein
LGTGSEWGVEGDLEGDADEMGTNDTNPAGPLNVPSADA